MFLPTLANTGERYVVVCVPTNQTRGANSPFQVFTSPCHPTRPAVDAAVLVDGAKGRGITESKTINTGDGDGNGVDVQHHCLRRKVPLVLPLQKH